MYTISVHIPNPLFVNYDNLESAQEYCRCSNTNYVGMGFADGKILFSWEAKPNDTKEKKKHLPLFFQD